MHGQKAITDFVQGSYVKVRRTIGA